MRVHSALATTLALATIVPAGSIAAQNPRIVRATPIPGAFSLFGGEMPRAAIGITTSSGATVRDTLGVLVSSVYSGSPAEKSGIEEGSRIASVNGVNLKLAAADVGDDQLAGVMTRRLVRELNKLKPGEEVDLRIYTNGQAKSVKVKTVESADLYDRPSTVRWDDRATLGLNFAVTSNTRDTIGVFVMSVDEGGPAALAGIEEGSRIASINGVDVRAKAIDREDGVYRFSTVTRLEREISKLHAGDDAELRVYSAGQTRTVKVKATRAADLPHSHGDFTFLGGDRFMPLNDTYMRVNGVDIGDNVRDAIERAMGTAGRSIQGVGRTLDGIGFGLSRTRVVW